MQQSNGRIPAPSRDREFQSALQISLLSVCADETCDACVADEPVSALFLQWLCSFPATHATLCRARHELCCIGANHDASLLTLLAAPVRV